MQPTHTGKVTRLYIPCGRIWLRKVADQWVDVVTRISWNDSTASIRTGTLCAQYANSTVELWPDTIKFMSEADHHEYTVFTRELQEARKLPVPKCPHCGVPDKFWALRLVYGIFSREEGVATFRCPECTRLYQIRKILEPVYTVCTENIDTVAKEDRG